MAMCGTAKARRALLALACAALLSSPASAYYFFVHYQTAEPPFVPIVEKFDLASLPGRVLQYRISSAGPEQLAPGDSFSSLVSQIRLAAAAWNGVPGSSLRLQFAGLADVSAAENTPAIDVLFDEMPPGLIAMGGPTARAEAVTRGDETFVPITKAVVVLNQDLSRQPSSSDGFFMTLVHEMGHALGLQHTFTSSVMSTGITRATSKARPLAADDVAAIAQLYPAPGFSEATGVITGRVVAGASGVSLASVVALSPEGIAVSALSNPDGTYRIAGLPPGNYYVYAHPLPPPVYGEASRGNIVMPRGPDGEPMVPDVYFDTIFFPGVKDVTAATPVSVEAGSVTEDVDFFTRQTGVPQIHSVTTYSFPGNVPVRAGYVSLDGERRFLVAYGFGLSSETGPLPDLRASVIGGSAVVPEDGLQPYAPDPRFVQINLEFHPFSGTGPRHLLFSRGGELYVLPSGLQLSQEAPPTIHEVAPAVDEDGAPAVVVVGERVTEATRILFDGVDAKIIEVLEPGRLLVEPPAAPSGHRAVVTALNPDGQSSWFLDGREPPVFHFEEREPASFSISPSTLPAGAEAMVEIRGAGTRFSRDTVLGFGSAGVRVKDVLVLGPEHVLANVEVGAGAPEGLVTVTAVAGLEVVEQPLAFRLDPPDPSRPTVRTPARDESTARPVAYIGKTALLRVAFLPPELSAPEVTLTLQGEPAEVLEVGEGTIRFRVPSTVRPGWVVARLTARGSQAYPVLLKTAVAPPRILSVHTASGAAVSAENPALPGELVQIRVTDLGLPEDAVEPDQVKVFVAGIGHSPTRIVQAGGGGNVRIVQFVLGTTVPAGEAVSLMVQIDGRPSAPVAIPVAQSAEEAAAAP